MQELVLEIVIYLIMIKSLVVVQWIGKMKKIKVKDIVNIAQKSHCSNHKNRPYEIIVYEEEETIILEYIKEKYFYSKKSIINKSKLKKIKANLID